MDLRPGAAAIGKLVAWTLGRTWLAIVLSVATIGAFGAWGMRHPLPTYGIGLAIIDAQMRRSHAIGAADVLISGDSSSLYGVDARGLEEGLGGDVRVQSLSAIGPARPPGYAKLLANYLAREKPPRMILLLLHPLGLMHDLKGKRFPEEGVVLGDAWPARSFREEAVAALNFHLFRGALEEPLEGENGIYYGTGAQLRRLLDEQHGSLVLAVGKPLPVSERKTPGPGVSYALNDDARRDLAAARVRLEGVDPARIYVGLMPALSAMVGDLSEQTRVELLTEITGILGIPRDHALDTPISLPSEEFGDITHALPSGQARLTRALVPVVRAALDAQSPEIRGH